MTAHTEPITAPSAWHGRELQTDRRWEHTLTPTHVAELSQALDSVANDPFTDLDLGAFQLPALTELMRAIRHELLHGRGLALLHGFPVEAYTLPEIERLYWGLAGHLGTAVTQNSQAGLIHYVTDGKLQPRQGSRGVGKPGPVTLHVDLSDCVSLLCFNQAPDDPPSRLASSTHVYNELLRQHPEALPRLYEGFAWDRQEEQAEGESATTGYRVPLFSQRDGVVSCRYNRSWINKAATRLESPLTPEENEILDFIDAVAAESCLEFPFQPGDIQFANNYTVLHGRAGHAEVTDDVRKRVLLRLWHLFDGDRPFVDEGLIRFGIISHGALGWTASDLKAGRHLQPRARTAAGVPVV